MYWTECIRSSFSLLFAIANFRSGQTAAEGRAHHARSAINTIKNYDSADAGVGNQPFYSFSCGMHFYIITIFRIPRINCGCACFKTFRAVLRTHLDNFCALILKIFPSRKYKFPLKIYISSSS